MVCLISSGRLERTCLPLASTSPNFVATTTRSRTGAERVAHQLFVRERAIDLSRVKERHAEVHGLADQRDRLVRVASWCFGGSSSPCTQALAPIPPSRSSPASVSPRQVPCVQWNHEPLREGGRIGTSTAGPTSTSQHTCLSRFPCARQGPVIVVLLSRVSSSSPAVWQPTWDELLADFSGPIELRRVGIDTGRDVHVDVPAREGGVGKVGDAVRAHAGSRFEVVLLVMGRDRLGSLTTKRASGGEQVPAIAIGRFRLGIADLVGTR